MTLYQTAKQKVLINNAVPLNCGDAALLIALYRQLVKKGHEVQIASYNYNDVIAKYPELPIVKELLLHRIFHKIPWAKKLLFPFAFNRSKAYQKADVIIGCPGGYVNSFYNIQNSLSSYRIAFAKKKKTAIYAQSIGPLHSADQKWFKNFVTTSLNYLMVRDEVSNNFMQQLNIPNNKYSLSKDAAFMLPYNLKTKTTTNKVAISVREWNHEDRNTDDYILMIQQMVGYICNDLNKEVVFLSTCQGLNNYKNDAVLAQKIKNGLPKEIQNFVSVNKNYHTLNQLTEQLRLFDFVIGTRLHMCILSMINGVPALNISYEIKGKECYNYLGLDAYSIDYNEPLNNALSCLKNFVKQQQQIQTTLTKVIPKVHDETLQDFEHFYNNLFLR